MHDETESATPVEAARATPRRKAKTNGTAHPVAAASIDQDHWIGLAAEICERAAEGDFEARLLHTHAVPGELGRMLRAINRLLDVSDSFVRESAAALDHAARGKFYRRVHLRGMPGFFRQAAAHINRAEDEMALQAKALSTAETERLGRRVRALHAGGRDDHRLLGHGAALHRRTSRFHGPTGHRARPRRGRGLPRDLGQRAERRLGDRGAQLHRQRDRPAGRCAAWPGRPRG